jgi:APA family basic amino acid/polyamine antiporter
VPPDRLAEAERVLARAAEVADEYASVEVDSGYATARSAGDAIVERAREHAVEAIVMGAEPPTRIRGGAVLGGVRGAKPAEVGPTTQYVLRNAPCRVLLTAPPDPDADLLQPAPPAPVGGE